MRVAYFSNQFATRSGTGIARYAHCLLEALRVQEGGPRVLPVASWSNLSGDELDHLRSTTGLELLQTGRRATPLLWMTIGLPRIESMLSAPVDLVHAVSLGYAIPTRHPLVVTVHDVGPLTHPQYFPRSSRWIMKAGLAKVARHSDAFLCVSQATADELQECVRGDISGRVHVTHEGVSARFFDLPDPGVLADISHRLPEGVPVILSAGKASPRKNLVGVVRALGEISRSTDAVLVLVGGQGWGGDEACAIARQAGVSERVIDLGFVTEDQLRALYRRATVYVHPSLFEGFGLTVLEAMAAGCPVVTSNRSSLPEVAGNAAILVDPEDVTSIAKGLAKVLLDEQARDRLVEAGLERARLFTWGACAEKTLEVYRTVLQGEP